VTKLAAVAQALREGTETCFSITRLTSLKRLCRNPQTARRFCLYLTMRTQERMEAIACPKHIGEADWAHYKALVGEAIAAMRGHLVTPDAEGHVALRDNLSRIIAVQNEYQRQGWNTVRLIRSRDVLVAENALHCFLSPDMAPYWAYRAARAYAERYDFHYGTGLIPNSAPLLEDIVRFWYSIE
jgi:hypothetical protein